MLAVGNGSCYLIGSDGEYALFDAGSGSFLGVGDSVIVPALRRLGVTSIPKLIISHGDVDHFAAAIEVIQEFETRTLIVTPHFIDEAEREPFGPEAHLVQTAERTGVSITTAVRGWQVQIGRAHLKWLHPEPDASYERVNDSSAVIHVEFGSGGTALLTGDIQDAGIAAVLNGPGRGTGFKADVLELPHHGGWSEEAAAFVRHVGPKIVLQSTGASRLRRDRWADELLGTSRYISVVHGATECVFKPHGEVQVSSYREGQRPAAVHD
jgi:competence protein ComEC